ncbi:alkaline phosphatase D family protein [Pseudomonas vanderleydeniana]|uniref:Alkaline phosphatase D family protein n=1 Tax=Pseudomonas vanderleydeniana TaxID=2745495 RepID=A0A9E6TTR4_9PSED|nr:alkaline phosphatase D family protein [Pseudomonas vanderleydeniana]QXI29535.1 alkaline phosphatase D family protein [Pseudomonas vanderleydeniana]
MSDSVVQERDTAPFDPDRRRLLVGMAGAAALSILSPFARSAGVDYPFTLGVASGDPLPDGFVIWTRLAPAFNAADGRGGLDRPVPVRWLVATDAAMSRVVQRGEVMADNRFAHSVHVEVAGLEAGRPYWYQFESLGAQSPVGQSRTTPPLQALTSARLGFVSCSHWERGYFSAYRHLAAEQPDLVFFLGDYIYDSSYTDPGKIVRPHGAGNARTLVDYRNRYALYRTDPDLQALHACAPCAATWDDHEVQNDYANQWSQDPNLSPQAFLKQRAAAYQAFYEHMPLRASSLPRGPDMRIYRRLDYGQLAQFHILDGRQYRSEQPCIPPNRSHQGHVAALDCVDLRDPKRTMLGWEQEAWLDQGFARSTARWNVIAQDLLVAPILQRNPSTQELGRWTDGWDGYAATRDRVLQSIERTRVNNPVFWGGDIHSFWTTDLHLDGADPDSKIVATEFIGTSVTSDGPPFELFNSLMPLNPHVRFFDSRQHGYVSVELEPGRMLTSFRAISERADPRATVSTLKQFVVEDGRAGALTL